MLDQAADREWGNLIQTRRIPWNRTNKGVSNNGSAFSVIEWGPRQGKSGSGR